VIEPSSGKVYHESAFRYLLNNETSRSRRSGLAYHVLFLYQDTAEGTITPMDAPVLASVSKVLANCLRETDYTGWYRDGQVVGGVLTAMGKESGAEQMESLRGRIIDALRDELGEKKSGGLRVRICSCDEWIKRGEQEMDGFMFHSPPHEATVVKPRKTAQRMSHPALAKKGFLRRGVAEG